MLNSIDVAKIEILLLLQPPSTEEAERFYLGLPSCPRLVGRASAGIQSWEDWETQHERWCRAPDSGAWFVMDRKALGAIGDHAIRYYWRSTVRDKILTAIGHLPCTSVDVFRIESTKVPLLERPVVVCVGVEHGDIAWDTVSRVLRACRQILDAVGLTNVDCQIRVSKVAPLAGPPLLRPPSPDGFSPDLHFLTQSSTTAIGQSIFPFSKTGWQGTLGVYLTTTQPDKDDKDDKNSPLYALTCHHVAFPKELYLENLHYSRQDKESGSLPLAIGLPGQSDTAAALEELLYLKGLSSVYKDDGDAEKKEQRRIRFGKVDAFYNAIKAFEPVKACEIGSVCLSPPIGQGSHQDHITWTRDWCLVKLDRSKFPNGDLPSNLVDLRSPKMRLAELAKLINSKKCQPMFQLPEDSLLPITGVIPLKEIRNPPGPTINVDGDECILVGKRGTATGLTWGSPSELESTVRNCLPNGGTFVSQEWAIHGSLKEKTVPFSGRGDSGAAVFGIDGRLGGFFTRGTDPNAGLGVDISYATPAALVFADIEAVLEQPVVLL